MKPAEDKRFNQRSSSESLGQSNEQANDLSKNTFVSRNSMAHRAQVWLTVIAASVGGPSALAEEKEKPTKEEAKTTEVQEEAPKEKKVERIISKEVEEMLWQRFFERRNSEVVTPRKVEEKKPNVEKWLGESDARIEAHRKLLKPSSDSHAEVERTMAEQSKRAQAREKAALTEAAKRAESMKKKRDGALKKVMDFATGKQKKKAEEEKKKKEAEEKKKAEAEKKKKDAEEQEGKKEKGKSKSKTKKGSVETEKKEVKGKESQAKVLPKNTPDGHRGDVVGMEYASGEDGENSVVQVMGIRTDEEEARASARALADATKRPVQVVHNPTATTKATEFLTEKVAKPVGEAIGAAIDSAKAIFDRFNPAGAATEASTGHVQREVLERLERGERVDLACHSQGSVICANALNGVSKLLEGAVESQELTADERNELLGRVTVYAVGSFAARQDFPEGVQVVSVNNEDDPVSALGGWVDWFNESGLDLSFKSHEFNNGYAEETGKLLRENTPEPKGE